MRDSSSTTTGPADGKDDPVPTNSAVLLYAFSMSPEERAAHAAEEAKRLEEAGDGWGANEAWRRYERIVDATRSPAELAQRSRRLRRVAASIRLLDEPST